MFRSLNKFVAAGALALSLLAVPAAHAASQSHVYVAAVGEGAVDTGTATPAPVPGYQEPETVKDAADDVMLLLKLKRTGQWVAFALVLSQLVIFGIKKAPKTNSMMKKWGTVVVLVLSSVAAILGSLVVGLSLPEAVLVFLSTGAPKMVTDLFSELGVIPRGEPKADPEPAPETPAA